VFKLALPFYLLLCLYSTSLNAHKDHSNGRFIENKGQWKQDFSYQLNLSWGQLYFSDSKVLIDTWDHQSLERRMDCAHHNSDCSSLPAMLNKHAFEIQFINPAPEKKWIAGEQSAQYFNYYLGNDPKNWKSEVHAYESILCKNLWNGIDLNYYTKNGSLKYDLLVSPGANLKQIQLEYSGVEEILIKNRKLIIHTSVGVIEELEPVAYQLINGKLKSVKCAYKLVGKRLSFMLGNDYNSGFPLVIDPQIIFSTYSGSTGDNWGATATYDSLGCAYLGGINFATGYPTTLGAYQSAYAEKVDITVTKFNPTGSAALYSTYLGGNFTEIPISMVVDNQGNLIVLGSTGSSDFPTSVNAYDASFNGGTSVSFWPGMNAQPLGVFPNGVDFFVSKFSSTGNQLVASTLLGGTGNDGLNQANGLEHNYGDTFRGEVISDQSNNIYVVGSTLSGDLPIVNAWQSIPGGGQDACVFKLNSQLSVLMSCSYFGGSGDDSGYGMQLGLNNSLYFCGGTTSNTISGNTTLSNQSSGGVDGYVARINSNGGPQINFTFLGTSEYDQCYFVQIDNSGDAIVLGQTAGNYPITEQPGQSIYSIANGSLFFHKLNASLSQTSWSTRFGTPGSINHLVPTAFLVDYCDYISFCLWAGIVNDPLPSTTSGLPVTSNAFQATTTGSDFYLGVLTNNAANLNYGTFFGGSSAYEHVDGGTSRFDKKGIIYQAICSGCGSVADDMPVTGGVWSATNNSNNCNAAVFKFDLSEFSALIQEVTPSALCVGQEVQFRNLSTGNSQIVWHFGDGNTSTSSNPLHSYDQPGSYEVMLVASGQDACLSADTAYVLVDILDGLVLTTIPVPPVCKGDTVALNVAGGSNYQWVDAPEFLPDQLQLQNPQVRPLQTTSFQVVSNNECGADTLSLTVPVIDFSVSITSAVDEICSGDSVTVQSTQAASFSWSPPGLFSNPSVINPTYTPIQSGFIYLTASNQNNCSASDSAFIRIVSPPEALAPGDTLICFGTSVSLSGIGGVYDNWYSENNLPLSTQTLTVSPEVKTNYYLVTQNNCGIDRDTVVVDVSRVFAVAGPTTSVCDNSPVQVFANGGTDYQWNPASDFSNPNAQNTTLIPRSGIPYSVTVKNNLNCSDTASLPVTTFPLSSVSAGPDKIVQFGERTIINGSADAGIIRWNPQLGLSCVDCIQPQATIDSTSLYEITLTDAYGCVYKDSMQLIVEGALLLPNAFTPNDDGVNDLFIPLSVDVEEFRMDIFNRWGELIFVSTHVRQGWNGEVKGTVAQTDVYVYKISYTLNTGRTGNSVGRVTLIR
jgi:gliding motility-associated-like protein